MESVIIMKPEYKIIETEVRGNIRIAIHSQYNNLNADTVAVEEDVIARLFGTVQSKLIIKKGARVYLHGSLTGTLENLGGEFYNY
jgi:hypothetical protein